MFNIVVDSLADGPDYLFKDVKIVPAIVYQGENALRDKIDIDVKMALELAKKGPVRTAGAPVGAFVKAVSELPKDVPVLIITASKGISSAYNNAMVAARMLRARGYKIEVVDSRSGCMGEGLVLEEAQRLRAEGVALDDAAESLRAFAERIQLYLTVDDVRFLAASGRINELQAFIGALLDIKPIIGVVDGRLVPIAKVRGRRQAMEWMAKKAEGARKKVLGAVAKDPEILDEFQSIVKDAAWVSDVSPGITVHVGPRAFGIAFYQ